MRGIDMVAGSYLHDFKRDNLVVLVESKVLGDTMALISNATCLASVPSGVVPYLASEVTLLASEDSDTLRQVHELKKRFDGYVVRKESVRKSHQQEQLFK
jgi:hypothetical protein